MHRPPRYTADQSAFGLTAPAELLGHAARAKAVLGCALQLAPRDAGLTRALAELAPPPTPPAAAPGAGARAAG